MRLQQRAERGESRRAVRGEGTVRAPGVAEAEELVQRRLRTCIAPQAR